MKIKEAIRLLKQYNEEEEIIIAWWDRSSFNKMTGDEWSEASEAGDDMDWSSTQEDLQMEISNAIEEEV
jgi:hypothetical protein|tara:strand:- start:30 stop:236 length:207 start_codon:yes stop_codon:yes gene_type:complete